MNRENVVSFEPLIQNFLELKVRTMAIVYGKSPELWYG